MDLDNSAGDGVVDISREDKKLLMGHQVVRWCVYALVGFPLIDFALRDTIHAIHPLGVVWDKLLLVAVIILGGIRYFSGFRPRWYSWQRFAGLFMVYGLGLMVAGMATPMVAVQGYRIDVYYMIFGLLVPFLLDEDDVLPFLHLMGCVAMLIAVDGIYQYITKVPIPYALWGVNPAQVRTRVFSVLQSPNELGAYMAMMTPLVAGLALYERHRFRKILYMVGTVCCLLCLLFTFTRGAWVAFALALLVMAVLFERRLFVVLVVVGVVAFFLPPIHHRVGELLTPVYWIKSTSSGRLARWLVAFDKMSASPLFGIGVGHYGGAVSAIYHSGIYSDNYYAKTLGETGLFGLVMFLALHLALVRDLFRNGLRHASGRTRYVFMGGIAGLIAVIIHNSMENVFEFAANAVTYFTLASLLLVWGRRLAPTPAADSSQQTQRASSPSRPNTVEQGGMA